MHGTELVLSSFGATRLGAGILDQINYTDIPLGLVSGAFVLMTDVAIRLDEPPSRDRDVEMQLDITGVLTATLWELLFPSEPKRHH